MRFATATVLLLSLAFPLVLTRTAEASRYPQRGRVAAFYQRSSSSSVGMPYLNRSSGSEYGFKTHTRR